MTHPTYTHPGTNAALLNISRSKRAKFLWSRDRMAMEFQPGFSRDPQYRVALKMEWLAHASLREALDSLARINRRFS